MKSGTLLSLLPFDLRMELGKLLRQNECQLTIKEKPESLTISQILQLSDDDPYLTYLEVICSRMDGVFLKVEDNKTKIVRFNHRFTSFLHKFITDISLNRNSLVEIDRDVSIRFFSAPDVIVFYYKWDQPILTLKVTYPLMEILLQLQTLLTTINKT